MNVQTDSDRGFATKRGWHGMAAANIKLLCCALVLSASLFSRNAWGSGSGDAVSAHAEATNIANIVSSWLEPYQGRSGAKTEYEDEAIYLRRVFGVLPSVFSTFGITVAIYTKDREVSFIGYLPTIVPEERRRAMVEFIFRGEWEYGLSTASMILDADGRVRCQAWLPFESFTLQPKESKWRLMQAVVDKLWSFSEGTARVALGEDPVKAAANIRRMTAFERLDNAAELEKSADADAQIVLSRCFDKDVEIKVGDTGNKWLDQLAGCGEGVRIGIIHGHFEDVIRDMGGRYDVLPYSLVVREGVVWNICNFPEECPDGIVGEVACTVMKMNENLKYSLFSVDFNTGKIWCHYALPVSVIPAEDERSTRNLYGALLKIIPVRGVAQNSEALHSAMTKASPRTDEGDGSALSSSDTLSQQAGTVATWLLSHLKDTKWEMATNGVGRIGVSGLVRGGSPNAADCSFGFELDDVGGVIVCRGALSKAVPEAKLAEVEKLLFRCNSWGGISIGAMALGKDRRVQCRASFPLHALRTDPKSTIRRLSTNVLIPLLEFSDAATRVCRDGQKPEEAFEAAAYPNDVVQLLRDPDAGDESCDLTSEEEKVIESWFDALGIKFKQGIESELTVYYRDKGNVGQDLRECFVMCGDVILAQCRLNLVIPEDRRKAVSDFALAYNAAQPTVSIHMGYGADPGDSVYFQYLMPVSVLRARKRNSVARQHFRLMLDMARRSALELSPKIQKIVSGDR